MSRLYDYFLLCWTKGDINDGVLDVAVSKGYITEDEKTSIMS